MLRAALFVLSCAPAAIGPAAFAQPQTSELCAVSAGIVGHAVEQRRDGAALPAAQDAVIVSLGDDHAEYVPAVEPIVEWVYTLPEDQLTDEVAEAYAAACLEQ